MSIPNFGASAIAVAAGLALTQRLLSIDGLALSSSIWLLTILGIICWTEDRRSLSRYSLLPSAGVALALPLIAQWFDASVPIGMIQMLSAIAACLAFGSALAQAQTVTFGLSPSRRPEWKFESNSPPVTTLWCLIGSIAVAATFSSNPSWAALALFAIASAMLVQPTIRPSRGKPHSFDSPDRYVLLAGFASVVLASALAMASLAAGQPFGWSVAGAAIAALVSLFVLAGDLAARTDLDLTRLRRSAGESRTDALTGTGNRRAFDERLGEEIDRANRYGHPLSLLMIDIDDFKLVNDRLGHAAGDQNLQAVSSTIERSIRTIDIAARYGGEEFVVILPETHLDGAAIVAERIRVATTENESPLPVTVSVGAAELRAPESSPAPLLDRADTALYRAKRSGKNRVELFR